MSMRVKPVVGYHRLKQQLKDSGVIAELRWEPRILRIVTPLDAGQISLDVGAVRKAAVREGSSHSFPRHSAVCLGSIPLITPGGWPETTVHFHGADA